MKWQSAYYSGYTTNETPPLSYEITNSTTMDVAPLVNSGTSLPFQLHFTFGGSDNTVVETGAVKIRVPRYLFQLPDGTHVGNFKTSLPLAPAIGGTTMCHYYIDGDDIVITNYAPISEATSLTFVMEYSVSPAAVPVDMVTGIYTNAVHATVTVQRDPAIEPESRDSNELVINYQTDAKLSRINKTGTSLEGWNPAWGAAPADSKDYFYVEWYIPITWNGYLPGVYPYTVGIPISQGFDLSLQDIAANGGQAVAWRTAYVSPSKNKVADTADMTDNWAEFHADMSPLASWHSPYPYEYYAWVYVTVRYPREGNIYWDAVSKTFKAKVTNTATATLDGLYNAYDQKTAAATHIYEEKPWFPEGAGGIYKRVYYHISSGMLTRLEQAGQLGLTGGILPFPNAGYVWNMQTDWVEDWARTKVGDVYGQQEWTAVRLDNEQYLNSAYGAASQYRLQPGDYSFTHIVLTRPGEQIYGEPSILGTNKLIPQPYANYGTVTVQASGTLSNDGPWADVATVTVNPDGTWNVTPAAGTGGAANLAETASHSLPLPPNTTGVRLLQTTKSARATQLYYLQTAYYPTPSLLAAIQASPTYIANREVDMHNKAWHWATGGGMPDSLRAQDSEYFRMTEFEGYSNILKTMRVTGSNSSLAQETAEVTITAHDVLPIPASTTLEEAIALGLLAEQRTGAFYDLLPPGVTFSPATIRTYRYSGRGDTLSSLIVPHTYEIIPDFRGTGCTMLIIRPSIPDGAASNYTVFDNNLRSGFTVQFSIYNSWQNIMDNGNTATNHVAYQSFADKPLFEGHSDIAPSTWLDYVEQAYLDVNGDGHDNAGDFLHAKSTLTFKLLPNIQIGYDKFVKAADENAYTKSTRVMGGGEYSYQLKLTTQAEAHASDLVFYDSLEMDAELPRGRETWMGTLLDYDITHPFRVYNVLPTVYYAARTMDPKAFDADRLFNRDTGELNPGWMLMPSDGSIPADLVSIAFDMRYDREGNPFVLGPELSLIIFMYMRAPADTAPYLLVCPQSLYQPVS